MFHIVKLRFKIYIFIITLPPATVKQYQPQFSSAFNLCYNVNTKSNYHNTLKGAGNV